jgi:iron complex outermembrane receptor protein
MPSKVNRAALWSAVGTASISLIPSGTWAQIAVAPPAVAANSDGGQAGQSSAPTEIIVTAQKREQNINKVGLTIAAIGGDQIKERKITNLANLAEAVPGLSFTNSANNTPVYTLRGIGFYETSLAAYPAVSVYLDQFPLSFPALTKHSSYDLERVEVLKGPQGTLFGQNATGGAINFIAAKPTDHFSAGVTADYGRFNAASIEGYVSGPLADGLTGRVSGRIERADDWQESNSRPGDTLGKVRNYMGRVILNYAPDSPVRFSLNVNAWQDRSDTQAPQFIGIKPQYAGFLSPLISIDDVSPQKPRAADWTPGIPFADNKFIQAGLRTDYDLSDDVTLTSLTSYVYYKQRQGEDGDGLPVESLDLTQDLGQVHSFNQEVRLSNKGSDRFRWVVGGNYERSRVQQQVHLSYPDSSANIVLSPAYPIVAGIYTSNQLMRNYAGFANGEYDIIPQVTLKAGIRYTQADRKADICNASDGPPYIIGNFIYDSVLGGKAGPYHAGECFSINDQSTTIGGIAPGMPGPFRETLNQHNVSWRAGADWKPSGQTLLYANVSKGYKAGSFPTLSATTFAQNLPVVQESVMAYEAGYKLSLLDHKLQFNGAVYYYQYRNKQLRSKTIDPTFNLLDILVNIPKSSVKGAEAELIARPFGGLSIDLAATYTDAKVIRYSGVNAGGVSANFAGTPIPYTPKWQLSVNPEYTFPVSESLTAFVGSSISYRAKTFAVIGGDINPVGAISPYGELYKIKQYTLVDLRAGVATRNDRWKFEVYGKNVFNKYYWNNVVAAYDTIDRYAGMPATWGMSISHKF